MATKTKGGAARAKAAAKKAATVNTAEALDDARQSEQVKQQQATGRPFPESEANTLNEHAVPASQIAASVEGGENTPAKRSGAAANAESMDAAAQQLDAKEQADQKQEDNSIFGRIRRSGLFFVREHVTGDEYVGPSPQTLKDAAWSQKRNATVTGLDTVSPRTGMEVRPIDGEPFTVGDGFGPDAKPSDWAAVVNTHTKKPLFG